MKTLQGLFPQAASPRFMLENKTGHARNADRDQTSIRILWTSGCFATPLLGLSACKTPDLKSSSYKHGGEEHPGMMGGHDGMMGRSRNSADTGWEAPLDANTLKNPISKNAASLQQAKQNFAEQCASCHGATGKGDAPMGLALNPKAPDLTSDKLQAQSDGAIFWKLSEGKGMMPPMKNRFEEEQRWALVAFLRTLAALP